jgi:nucleotide-binding universal stress UspA family protein
MSYILTTAYPIANGDAAVHYAAGLALASHLPLRVVYPYTVPVSVGEIPMPMLPVEEVREAANSRISEVVKSLSTLYPSLQVSSNVVYGMLTDILDDELGEGKPAPLLTVIGNDEEEGSDAWLGGETTDILRDGHLPVLAVPHTTSFRMPQHVCLACDTRSITEGMPVVALQAWQKRLGFRITVLHVVEAGQAVSYEGSVLEGQLTTMAAGYAEVSVTKEVDKAIADFAALHGMDWLAIAPHHYGFWEGLFHKSHTSRVLHLAHVPVLALH